MTSLIDASVFAAGEAADRNAARAAFRARRAAALAELLQAREAFADSADAAYSSGRSLAAHDSDALEEIGGMILDTVDRLKPRFERLDVAADVVGYAGPNGRRYVRAVWDRMALGEALAEALQAQLGAEASAVLGAAVRLHAAG